MKIWFDLTNSPHVHFFRDMIAELKEEGHEILVTTRDQANTIDLLKLYHIDYMVVGSSYGKKLSSKVKGNINRARQLAKIIKREKVDVAISQSSFTSAIAGRLAGVPTIYTNDNEHAMGNKVSFVCAHHIFIPEFIPINKVTNLLVSKKKVQQYPGVKEGIYLWRKYLGNGNAASAARKKIFLRPEPYYAQYYKGKENPFDDDLVALKDEFDIVVLPRDKTQAEHYKSPRFSGITVAEKPLTLDEIVNECQLFIGAGGTMTREMAVIGIPTISIYQDELLDVDRYLIEQGLMTHNPQVTAQEIREAYSHATSHGPNAILLERGRETYHMFKDKLLSLKK